MTKLPPRYLKTPIKPLFNHDISDAAYRLYHIILAFCWETGECDLSNSDFAALVDKSRQYIGKLLGELYSCQLLVEETLDDHRLIKPLNETNCQPASYSTDAGNCSLQNGENIVSSSAVVDVFINSSNVNLPTTTREAETPVSPDEQLQFTDKDYALITSKWQHYFGVISPIMCNKIGDYLDDKDLLRRCNIAESRPAEWILDAVEQTALAKPRNEQRYFIRIINDWINNGREDKQDAKPNKREAKVTPHATRNADGSYNI